MQICNTENNQVVVRPSRSSLLNFCIDLFGIVEFFGEPLRRLARLESYAQRLVLRLSIRKVHRRPHVRVRRALVTHHTHLRRYLMVRTHFQHVLATHQQSTQMRRVMLEDLELAGASLFHLLRRWIETVELGALAEANGLVLLAGFDVNGRETNDGIEGGGGLFFDVVSIGFLPSRDDTGGKC